MSVKKIRRNDQFGVVPYDCIFTMFSFMEWCEIIEVLLTDKELYEQFIRLTRPLFMKNLNFVVSGKIPIPKKKLNHVFIVTMPRRGVCEVSRASMFRNLENRFPNVMSIQFRCRNVDCEVFSKTVGVSCDEYCLDLSNLYCNVCEKSYPQSPKRSDWSVEPSSLMYDELYLQSPDHSPWSLKYGGSLMGFPDFESHYPHSIASPQYDLSTSEWGYGIGEESDLIFLHKLESSPELYMSELFMKPDYL